jgi:hypothetical protein
VGSPAGRSDAGRRADHPHQHTIIGVKTAH